ncbi:beta-galactosidase [uncultured Bacteroides sp.]|uniref:beta-galactosidase n=1 Tax=uncultured Bacteroides sp. TaxID=162156 RepID=UPI002AA82C45|nr:beta-galactosidase [uncultured Bacteroides sp.]
MKLVMTKHVVSALLIGSLSLLPGVAAAQQKQVFDVSNVYEKPLSGHFKMGNPGSEESRITINSRYLMLGEKPFLPVMGEFHFSRVKRDHWLDVILKMKACGIRIISTYFFWNRHEEVEGQFDWEGEKDVRAFVELCKEQGLFVFLRVGPWAHGEARNGGTPDWILRKKFIKDRSDDEVYQNYVKRYFAQIAAQVRGLYYKDGGNIIGIQLENEYWYAKAGEAYIQWLKDTVMKLGMDVPIYTVTGWSNGSVPPYQVIPLWGAYPDAPWSQHVQKEYQPGNFKFDSFRDNKKIGNDQIKSKDVYMTYEDYPFFTCEMGVGIQNTYHRRLVIDPIDGLGLITAKLGSGSNLLGYYVFSGGTQFRGLLHPTNEDQDETGYWTRVPAKSYDFQAAIKESGEISEAYKQLKKLHYFVDDFGSLLAPMATMIGTARDGELQTAVRSDNHSGFLFGIHYARYQSRQVSRNNRFSIRFQNEKIEFPRKGVDISDSTIFIWPLNLRIGNARMKYATAQLIDTVGHNYLFFQNKNIPVEMAFDAAEIADISVPDQPGAIVRKEGTRLFVAGLQSGKNCLVTLRMKNGTIANIVVLTQQEADNCWLFTTRGQKKCFISSAGMYADKDSIYVYSQQNRMEFSSLKADGRFIGSVVSTPERKPQITLTSHPLFKGVQWLETGNLKEISANEQLNHRFFFKEFSLDNPSAFRKVTLYLYPETEVRINLNNQWVSQSVTPGKLNAIDLKGYAAKGENTLFLAFPYTVGEHKFAARMVVEYMNYDRVEMSTDSSWLATDMYSFPSSLKAFKRPLPPKVVVAPAFAASLFANEFREWNVQVPVCLYQGGNEVYLHLNYTGDRAELYNGYTLSADDFNANVPWSIGLQRQERSVEGSTLRLIVYPLSKDEKIFFDIPPVSKDYGQCRIDKFEANPEYKIRITQ